MVTGRFNQAAVVFKVVPEIAMTALDLPVGKLSRLSRR